MRTLEIIWAILLVFFGLGLAGALIYLFLGAVGLIFLIPQLIATAIVTGVATLIGIFIGMVREFGNWSFDFIGRLFGLKKETETKDQKTKAENTQFFQERTDTEATVFDPFQILEIPRGAGSQQIREAYLRQMSQYHPDKVTHLGKELQELAEEKAKSIQRAYSSLQSV